MVVANFLLLNQIMSRIVRRDIICTSRGILSSYFESINESESTITLLQYQKAQRSNNKNRDENATIQQQLQKHLTKYNDLNKQTNKNSHLSTDWLKYIVPY
jgi:hypothetical protein